MALFPTKASGPCTKGFPIGCLVVLAAAGRTGAFTRDSNMSAVLIGFMVFITIAYVICHALDAIVFRGGADGRSR